MTTELLSIFFGKIFLIYVLKNGRLIKIFENVEDVSDRDRPIKMDSRLALLINT